MFEFLRLQFLMRKIGPAKLNGFVPRFLIQTQVNEILAQEKGGV